jgi:hypothetical protein
VRCLAIIPYLTRKSNSGGLTSAPVYGLQDVRQQGSSPHAPDFGDLSSPRACSTSNDLEEGSFGRGQGCHPRQDQGQRCQASWCHPDQGSEEERFRTRFGWTEHGHGDRLDEDRLLTTGHLLGSCGVDRISPAADCQRAIIWKPGKAVERYLGFVFSSISLFAHPCTITCLLLYIRLSHDPLLLSRGQLGLAQCVLLLQFGQRAHCLVHLLEQILLS